MGHVLCICVESGVIRRMRRTEEGQGKRKRRGAEEGGVSFIIRAAGACSPLPAFQAGHDVHGVECQPPQEVQRVAGPLTKRQAAAAATNSRG